MRHQILAVVSHELRTPLAAVIGYAGLLRMTVGEELPPHASTYLDKLVTQADQLQHAINMLIDAACIQAGTLGLISRPIRPDKVLADACALALTAVAQSTQTLEWDLATELPTVYVDQGRLAQVLGALLANALKFAPVSGRVCLRARNVNGRLRVEIEDDGPGVPAEQRAMLFKTFSQADMTTTRATGGLGLGLFVSRSLIEAMGGQLDLGFPPQGGCLAWFELPAHTKDGV